MRESLPRSSYRHLDVPTKHDSSCLNLIQLGGMAQIKALFERFSTKKDGTLWYYSSLFAVFKDRGVPMATAIEEAVTALLKNATG